jgi:hypothetical protein
MLFRKIEQQYPNKMDHFIRAYFLAMLSPQLYDSSNIKLLLRFEGILHSLTDESRSLLVRWMRDIEGARLAKMIGGVQNALTQQITKSQPNSTFGNVNPLASHAQTVLIHCRFLELMFRTNQMKERVSYELFKNKAVMQHYDPVSQFKGHFKGNKTLNFLRYPFLLNLNYLHVLMISFRNCYIWKRVSNRRCICKKVYRV